MMRLATTAAIALLSTGTAIAQETAAGPAAPRSEQQTCVFAGGSYSEGAEFCVTAHAGLKCESGKWSRDTQLDCSEGDEHMMPQQGGGDDHMMPDHTMHMMPHQ
jgi:hypothetical protein